MLFTLLIGSLLTMITIAIHAVGTTAWVRLLRRIRSSRGQPVVMSKMVAILCGTGVYLLLLHLLEVTCWAFAYLSTPGIENLTSIEEAIYFSMVTFSSLGYGDIVIAAPYRLLSGIEAMTGLLIFGWSAALFFAILGRMMSEYLTETLRQKPQSLP